MSCDHSHCSTICSRHACGHWHITLLGVIHPLISKTSTNNHLLLFVKASNIWYCSRVSGVLRCVEYNWLKLRRKQNDEVMSRFLVKQLVSECKLIKHLCAINILTLTMRIIICTLSFFVLLQQSKNTIVRKEQGMVLCLVKQYDNRMFSK